MKKIILVFILFPVLSFAQLGWYLLPSSPSQSFRHDDVYFIDENHGWVINVSGQVWKTNDGGTTWNQVAQQSTSFRCVGFLDSLNGFIGNLGPGRWAPTTDTNPLYQTHDGGVTWTAVTNITGPIPKGICGMRIVNDSVIVACGRVEGPAHFMRSVDKGATWTSKDMSAYAGMLIDVSFISTDTGFAVGGTDSVESVCKAIILYTVDGGNTWTPKITGTHSSTLCWKITQAWKNKQVYYGSVERSVANDSLMYYRSTDGGGTWTEYIHPLQYGFSQGIGFYTDSIGWIGGNSTAKSTTDACTSFSTFTTLVNLNRIRFVNDSVGYGVGKRVYKYGNNPVGVANIAVEKPGYILKNRPNPFSGKTTIEYAIPSEEHVLLEVYDYAGRKIKTLVNERKKAGSYEAEFKLPQLADDLFICVLNAGDATRILRLISQK